MFSVNKFAKKDRLGSSQTDLFDVTDEVVHLNPKCFCAGNFWASWFCGKPWGAGETTCDLCVFVSTNCMRNLMLCIHFATGRLKR